MPYRHVILCLALAAIGHAQAATVFKCVDAQRRVTFTQQQCPENSALDDVVSAHNPTIAGSGPPARMASGAPGGRQVFRQSAPSASVTTTASPAYRDGCTTGLTEQDLRTAKVRGQIVTGMSRKDVESVYGRPNQDGHAQGAGSSTYWNDKYLSYTHVSYDSNGCVYSTSQSGVRR